MITRTVRKNQDNLYISIPKETVNLLDIEDEDILEMKIIKVHKKSKKCD